MIAWKPVHSTTLDSALERCIRPVLAGLSGLCPPSEAPAIALMIGMPSPAEMSDLARNGIPFVLLAASPWPDREMSRMIIARAAGVAILDSRELQHRTELCAATLLHPIGLGAPLPEAGNGGVRAAVGGRQLMVKLLDEFPGLVRDDPGTPAAGLGGGGGIADLAAARCAWADGAYVLGLPGCGYQSELREGGALLCDSVAEAEEAVRLLSSSAPLRRALSRRGRRALHAAPTATKIAEQLLEALAAASANTAHQTESTSRA